MSITDTAQATLTARGLTGQLIPLSGDRWVFRGERGSRGVSVDIQGEPDAALLDEAAEAMLAALDEDRIGR